jgi:hypothetical protein
MAENDGIQSACGCILLAIALLIVAVAFRTCFGN